MNVSLQVLITVLGLVGSLAFTWGYTRNKVENLEKADSDTDKRLDKVDTAINKKFDEENINLWNEISKLRNWREAIEKDLIEQYVEVQRELSKIREANGIKDGKMDEIIRRLETMDKKLDRLETDGPKR